MAGVTIRPLTLADLPEVSRGLRSNADHLNRWSDWTEEIDRPETERARDLVARGRPLAFAIRDQDRLIGCAGLVAVAPPRYSVSYWIDRDWTGRGVATDAVAFLCEHARSLNATDLYAGVAHGNEASIRVLLKNGFSRTERFDTYTRFHRPVS